MTLIGQEALQRAGRKSPSLRRWLAEWIAVVEDAEWHSLHDVRRTYPSADGVRLPSQQVVTIFNVKGTAYRLLTYIDYRAQAVDALEVMTHAEYSRDLWKSRY